MSSYIIKNTETIHLPKNAAHPVILELLQNYTLGVKWTVLYDADENTVFLGNAPKISTNGEEYAIEVTDEGAFIAGETYKALMNGFVDLLEKIVCTAYEQYEVELCSEQKSPKIAFRSVHLCLFPETELSFFKRSVRMAILSKYSHIVVEFWGTLKFESFSLLGWKNAYEKEQIKGILDEAKAFGVEVIPFFQHWGHASQSRAGSGKHVVLDQNPKYEYLFTPHSGGWVWDFENAQTLEILKNARNELIELCGDGEYFHIGCDEAESPQSITEAINVANHINNVAKELKKQGRKAIVWGDMLLSKAFFDVGNSYECNSSKEIANAMLDALSRDVIIADWQYNTTDEAWLSSKLFKEKGFNVLCCPYDKRINIRGSVNTAREESLGFMLTTWHTLHSSNLTLLVGAGWGAYDGFYNNDWPVYSSLMNRVGGMWRKTEPQDKYENYGWKCKQIET